MHSGRTQFLGSMLAKGHQPFCAGRELVALNIPTVDQHVMFIVHVRRNKTTRRLKRRVAVRFTFYYEVTTVMDPHGASGAGSSSVRSGAPLPRASDINARSGAVAPSPFVITASLKMPA